MHCCRKHSSAHKSIRHQKAFFGWKWHERFNPHKNGLIECIPIAKTWPYLLVGSQRLSWCSWKIAESLSFQACENLPLSNKMFPWVRFSNGIQDVLTGPAWDRGHWIWLIWPAERKTTVLTGVQCVQIWGKYSTFYWFNKHIFAQIYLFEDISQ